LFAFPAHWAPNGLLFHSGNGLPARYGAGVFVAFHGSWNRSDPTGYMVAHVDVRDGRPVSYAPFIDVWLRPDGRVTGRPVYPAVGSDGALYVSDDGEGRLWRVRWVGQ
jgi:glucose/arabinose dehydrogenase